jgi:MFS family permease
MAVLPSLFPDAAERSRALTIWVTSTAIGLPLGPIAGGWLLSHAWWGSVFLINVPMVIIGVAAVAAFVPRSHGVRTNPLDLPGVPLSSAGLAALTFGFIRAGQESWGETLALTAITGGALLLAGFAAWQLRARFPLTDFELFTAPGFRWGCIFLTLMGMLMFGVLFALPLFFQAVQGASTLSTGLRLLPLIGGLLVGSRVVDRLGDGVAVAIGFVLAAAGLAVGALMSASTPYGLVACWVVVAGIGTGMVLPAAMNAALGALPEAEAGSGSALIQALRQAGGTIGVALLGTILAAGYRSAAPRVANPALAARINDSVSAGVAAARAAGRPELLTAVQSAFVHGMSAMLTVSAAMAGVLAVVALAGFRQQPGGRHRARRGRRSFVDARESAYAGH